MNSPAGPIIFQRRRQLLDILCDAPNTGYEFAQQTDNGLVECDLVVCESADDIVDGGVVVGCGHITAPVRAWRATV